MMGVALYHKEFGRPRNATIKIFVSVVMKTNVVGYEAVNLYIVTGVLEELVAFVFRVQEVQAKGTSGRLQLKAASSAEGLERFTSKNGVTPQNN
jgi:hypothetical protein